MYLEIEALQNLDATVVLRVQILDLHDDAAALHLLLVDLVGDLTADHHRREIILADIGDTDGIDVLTTTDDRTVVGRLLDLLQLMGDEDDRLAGGGEVMDDVHKLVDFLRGQ